MHHLVIGPRKAATACGIRIAAYYAGSNTGVPDDGDPIACCSAPDYYAIEITCPKCRKAVGRSSLPSTHQTTEAK